MINQDAFYSELGRRIRTARLKENLTQQQLAELLSLNRTSITNIEKGKQKILAHMLIEIAEKLKVTADDLLPKFGRQTKKSRIDKLLTENSPPEERDFLQSVLNKARKK